MRVLIVKTSSMGDILHTLPSLTDAVKEIPEIYFDWVVEEQFAKIPRWHSGVNLIISVAIRRWRKAWFSRKCRMERKEFRKLIRVQKYDAIIDAQGLMKSAVLVTRLARGTKYGMDWKSVREPLASLFYNRCHYISKEQHSVERIRELFAKSLGYIKPRAKGDFSIAKRFFKHPNTECRPYFVFLHATTNDGKLWPEKRWRELIELMSPIGVRIKLPWYTERDYNRAKQLSVDSSHVEILPKLTLEQISGQLIRAKGVVSVDTGLSHLAAALDIPNITLFGPTDPKLIGGYGKNQYKIASRSKKMKDIAANDVFAFLKNKFLLQK